jgi:hypothetical protein
MLECYSPQTIVDKVKGRLVEKCRPTTDGHGPLSDETQTTSHEHGLLIDDNGLPASNDGPDGLSDNCHGSDRQINGPLISDATTTTENHTVYLKTPFALAQKIIDENRIEFCSKLKSFTVKSESGNLYSIQLFPKEKCWCGGTVTCCHIIAARIYIGLQSSEEIGVRHLAQLKKKKGLKQISWVAGNNHGHMTLYQLLTQY